MAKTPLTESRAADLLLAARMDIAMALHRSFDTQEELHRLMSITGDLYEGITGEEAPAFDRRPRMVKAS